MQFNVQEYETMNQSPKNNISDDHVTGLNTNESQDESFTQVTCGKYNLIVNHI